MRYTKLDVGSTPPRVEVPREYNASVDFIDRNLDQGRGDKPAYIDCSGPHTYRELAERANRAGNALLGTGLVMEQRVMMCLLDTIDFPAVFLGAIRAGLVPIPVNTLLTPKDYDYMVRDSRARALVISEALFEKFERVLEDQPHLQTVIVAGDDGRGHARLADLAAAASADLEPAPTTCDDVAFWLYTSGSTGTPKGSMHLQADLVHSAACYGLGVLGIEADDVVFSAAKLFFAYGLGNALSFPLLVGATAVLLADRPTPDSIMATLAAHDPTIYFGVPTLYGAILADPANGRDRGSARLRVCVSAGEALPERVGVAWQERFGVEILDGLGSTEMTHIFLSNRAGRVRYGTSGHAVPGYELRVVAEDGAEAGPGEIGELWVSGATSAIAYWNQREKSRDTFQSRWTRTGDKYMVDEQGAYVYCGRTDDMLKVSGHWVSPFEVESALVAHDHVLEAAVVGQADDSKLLKPKAFIVLKDGVQPSADLEQGLKDFVKGELAPFKYPRWIEFVDSLPKTATGKIQRFKLRDHAD